MPVMALALSSDSLPASELYDTAATILAQKIAQIQGVGEVEGVDLVIFWLAFNRFILILNKLCKCFRHH